MSTYDLHLRPAQLEQACAAWTIGAPYFGAWAVRELKPLTTKRYAELIALVRRELRDDIDYSKENDDGNTGQGAL